MHASGNWIQQKDEQMLLSFSAFDFCVSGSALCPKAAFLAISSQRVMMLLSKEKQSAGCQGNALLRHPAPRPGLLPWPWWLCLPTKCSQSEPRRDLYADPASLSPLPSTPGGRVSPEIHWVSCKRTRKLHLENLKKIVILIVAPNMMMMRS